MVDYFQSIRFGHTFRHICTVYSTAKGQDRHEITRGFNTQNAIAIELTYREDGFLFAEVTVVRPTAVEPIVFLLVEGRLAA